MKFRLLHICYGLIVWFSIGCKAQSTITPSAPATPAFKVPAEFNGFNTQMMRGPSWSADGFLDQVSKLHPKILRYPGGTVASYWDWQTGWLMKGIALRNDWSKIKEHPITLADLKTACDKTGAVPLLVLNMMNSTLEYQLEMLRAVAKAGMPVKYVELDNEIYLGEEFYVQKFPTGVDYAIEANKWIAAIRKEFPGVKIGIVGCAEKETANESRKQHESRTNTWNRDVLSTIKGADAMTFHIYGGSGLRVLSKSQGEGEVKAAAYQQAFDKKGSEGPVLSIPLSRWKTSLGYDYPILPSGMKAWITEYNMFEKEGVVAGTWMHGLYALLQSLYFMGDNRTGMIVYHNLTTSAQFAAIFNNGEGFFKSVRQKPTTAFGFTAAGYTMSLFGNFIEGNAEVTRLSFTSIPQIKGFRGASYAAVEAYLLKGIRNKILLINMSEQPYTVDCSGILHGVIKGRQISSGIKTQIANEKDVVVTEEEGSKITLRPYGVALIAVE